MKRITFILLFIIPVIFYSRGFISDIEFGANTLYFSLTYFLYWLLSLCVFLLIPKKWGAWLNAFAMSICSLFFLEFVYQLYTRSQGKLTENNYLNIVIFLFLSISAGILYAREKKWKDYLR